MDAIFIVNIANISGWNDAEMTEFIHQNIKIPVFSDTPWHRNISIFTIARVPQEQGRWSAQTALKILQGREVSSIPIVQNQEMKLFLNLKLGNRLEIIFKPALLRMAEIIH